MKHSKLANSSVKMVSPSARRHSIFGDCRTVRSMARHGEKSGGVWDEKMLMPPQEWEIASPRINTGVRNDIAAGTRPLHRSSPRRRSPGFPGQARCTYAHIVIYWNVTRTRAAQGQPPYNDFLQDSNDFYSAVSCVRTRITSVRSSP